MSEAPQAAAGQAELSAAVAALMPRARVELAELVACRSVHDPQIEDPAECARAADLVAGLLDDLGVTVTRHTTSDGSVALAGELAGAVGAPRVLLYSHYDVVPVGEVAEWTSDPWTLTERDGRWYGRGAADCKGNLLALLTAVRALRATGGRLPALTLVVEGSEEQGTGGLVDLVTRRPELFAADALVVADCGNIALGVPTLTTSLRASTSVRIAVRTMARPAHSGMYGGAAPDALQALLTALASLRGPSGETTIDGLDASATWSGAPYAVDRFREDAALLDGVDPLDAGELGDLLWARPAATVLAIDAPPTARVSAAVQGEATAIVNLRVPADMDVVAAQAALLAHLGEHTPYGLVEVEPLTLGRGFSARTDGPAYGAMRAAMGAAYGAEAVFSGQGGSIPVAVALQEANPEGEVMLLGVEEPGCHIHSPDESLDPAEFERTALALALFLSDYATSQASGPAGR